MELFETAGTFPIRYIESGADLLLALKAWFRRSIFIRRSAAQSFYCPDRITYARHRTRFFPWHTPSIKDL